MFNNIITLIFQCDLVPSWVLSRWLNVLKDDFPTIAFHASVNKSFGKVPSVLVDADRVEFHGSIDEIKVY